MQFARLNAKGLEQIAEALERHHKQGIRNVVPRVLCDRAFEAELNFASGKGCTIEITGAESKRGNALTVVIEPSGYHIDEQG